MSVPSRWLNWTPRQPQIREASPKKEPTNLQNPVLMVLMVRLLGKVILFAVSNPPRQFSLISARTRCRKA